MRKNRTKKDQKKQKKKRTASSQKKYGRGLWTNIRKMTKSAPFKKKPKTLKVISEDNDD
jgi:hypothetical protein